MTRAFVHFLRRSIARKLTLTLVGFVAVTTIAAGLYLNRALEAFAVDTLEVRLASIGRLLHDEARGLVLRRASPADFRAFTLRGSRPTASRVTVIAADGRVLGDSEVAVDDLPRVENHGARPEVLAALAGGVGRDRRTRPGAQWAGGEAPGKGARPRARAGEGHRDPRRHDRGRHRRRRPRHHLADERAGAVHVRPRRDAWGGQAVLGGDPQHGAARGVPRGPRGRRGQRLASRAQAREPGRAPPAGERGADPSGRER